MSWKPIEGRSRDLRYQLSNGEIEYEGSVPNLYGINIPVQGVVKTDSEKPEYHEIVIKVYLDIDKKYHI